ncbi:MAG: hypothetical protein KAS21_01740 [Candidatus Aminicenantes bacterium]|nr:hypothetical protein [Candidatus Aminicenantes bacterium]MCK5003775.1 hypothetical protein [Candidatus Aminicenantes bacterium]
MKRENILLILVIMVFLVLPSCNKLENETTSGSVLLINSITGNDLDGTEGSTTIFIDVLQINDDGSMTIYNDNGVAELTAVLLDPYVSANDTTYYQNIVVDQIDIEYTRSDGLNNEGDVIYSFSQKVTYMVPIGDTITLPFVLVQHVAKLESPLVELVGLGSEKVLKLEAKVTIHGKDVGGHRVAPAVGAVSVWISNFGDAE